MSFTDLNATPSGKPAQRPNQWSIDSHGLPQKDLPEHTTLYLDRNRFNQESQDGVGFSPIQ